MELAPKYVSEVHARNMYITIQEVFIPTKHNSDTLFTHSTSCDSNKLQDTS